VATEVDVTAESLRGLVTSILTWSKLAFAKVVKIGGHKSYLKIRGSRLQICESYGVKSEI
jgi:hypothetical protein